MVFVLFLNVSAFEEKKKKKKRDEMIQWLTDEYSRMFHSWITQHFWMNQFSVLFNDSLMNSHVSFLINQRFWMNQLSVLFNESLMNTVTCFCSWTTQHFWMNRMNELFSDSLENVTCHHLLALTKKHRLTVCLVFANRLVVYVFISSFRLC